MEVHNFEDKDVHKKNSYEYRYTATLTIHPTWLDTGNYVCHYKTNDTSMHVAYDRNQKYVYFQGTSIFSLQSDRFILILCIVFL